MLPPFLWQLRLSREVTGLGASGADLEFKPHSLIPESPDLCILLHGVDGCTDEWAAGIISVMSHHYGSIFLL